MQQVLKNIKVAEKGLVENLEGFVISRSTMYQYSRMLGMQEGFKKAAALLCLHSLEESYANICKEESRIMAEIIDDEPINKCEFCKLNGILAGVTNVKFFISDSASS